MSTHRLCPSCDRMKPESHFYRRSGVPRCTPHLRWTQARRFHLMVLVDAGKNDQQIARKLGTTETAVKLARRRYNIAGVYAHSLSGRDVARMMGIGCEKTVTKWIERGFLTGTRIRRQGPFRTWLVQHDALYAFVEDDRTWHLWRTERITDRMLRRHAERVRGDVQFLTPGEVAQRFCVQHGTVNQWIHKGWLPARKWGNWWIDSREVEEFELPRIGGRPRRAAA